MKNLSGKYAIVGVGYTPQGKIPGKTAVSFHVEACANAIRDAGLERKDIDGLLLYRHFNPSENEIDVTPYSVAQRLGLSPKVLSQEANCARTHISHAIGVLEEGLCDYVVLSYGDNARSGQRSFAPMEGDNAVFGQFGAVGGYAMAARRAMHDFQTGPETWKKIAVGQRKWANKNPRARMYKYKMTYEDYFNSRWVVEPFRLFDCCLISDGGRACVITSLDRAMSLKHDPVVILGFGQHNQSYDVLQSRNMSGPTGAIVSGEQAFQMSGLKIDDVDACEIYDCFTYTVEITLQDYGFFKPGEGKEWFDGGTIEPGGWMPVNTSGGLLSEDYFMGMTPLTEGVMQLMNRCGDRQLGPTTKTKKPNIILCSDNGGVLQTHSTTILGKV